MQITMLHIVRYALFGTLLLFSLIVLGISANFTNITLTAGFTYTFETLCVAVSVLTFVIVIPVFVIDFLRRGAFTSFVIVELAWVFVLMVLWIAAAGETSSFPLFPRGCNAFRAQQSICHQFQALQAFAWLNFIILFGWLITLSVFAVMTHNNGNPGIWMASVSDTQFSSKHSSGQPAMGTTSGGYPPQQHTGQMQQGYTNPAYYQSAPAQQPYQSTPPPVQQSYHQPVAEV